MASFPAWLGHPHPLRSTVQRGLSLATVVIVALSISLAVLSVVSIGKLRHDAAMVEHTDEVLAALGQALELTLDAETAQRGYVLTSDPEYLQPYRRAARASLLELDQLRRLVADNPSQTGRLAMLRSLTEKRLDLIDHVVDLHTTHGLETARSAIARGEGKRVQDQIRAVVEQMRNEERRLLVDRQRRSEASATLAQVLIVLATVMGVGMVLHSSAKLERRNAELAKANLAKSDFLATMSHEIRTPMNAIIGLTQLLERESLTAGQAEMVQRMRAAGRSLMTIINDILDLSRIEAGRLRLESRSFALAPLLIQIDSMLAPMARSKGLALRIESALASTLDQSLVGDPQRLEQILVNLVGNAVKFTEQGEIVLRTRVLQRDTSHVHLRFEVQDTGIGIGPEQLGQMFQPFSQVESGTARRHGGTGLGLSISKRLVELMGGRIGVDSVLGVGSTFWFEIDFALGSGSEAQHPVYGRAPTAPPGPRLAGMHLLAVDDNDTNLDLLSRALRLEGAEPTLARDGQQAVLAVRGAPDTFDAVLMDLQMPVMDGYEATRVIRSQLGMATLPIIIFSAAVLAEEKQRALHLGATHFLAKPIDIEEMVAVLSRYRRTAGPSPSPAPPPGEPAHEALPGPVPVPVPIGIPDDSWPQIEGVNVERMRRLLKTDFGRFIRLCSQVGQQGDDAVEALDATLAEHDFKRALNLLHDLRGAALNIGAAELGASLEQIEAEIRAGRSSAEQTRRLAHAVSQFKQAIGPWLHMAGK